MKCDLHVHTRHSGACTIPVVSRVCRESYNDPLAVYETLRRRGMDLVTITDHDSVGAAAELAGRPGFFLSEEVTCRMPSGTEIHMGVYDLSERNHVEIQRRAQDLPALLAYLNEQDLFFSINHVFSSLTGRRMAMDFEEFARSFPAYEVLNGAMLARTNRQAERLARVLGKAPLGGSDSHTMHGVGRVYTEVPGARTKEEYLAGLRAGAGRVHGDSGTYWKLTRDVVVIAMEMVRDKWWTAPLAPLALAVPVVTLVNYFLECQFASQWFEHSAPSGALAGEMAL